LRVVRHLNPDRDIVLIAHRTSVAHLRSVSKRRHVERSNARPPFSRMRPYKRVLLTPRTSVARNLPVCILCRPLWHDICSGSHVGANYTFCNKRNVCPFLFCQQRPQQP
jgi:hypothetical protein